MIFTVFGFRSAFIANTCIVFHVSTHLLLWYFMFLVFQFCFYCCYTVFSVTEMILFLILMILAYVLMFYAHTVNSVNTVNKHRSSPNFFGILYDNSLQCCKISSTKTASKQAQQICMFIYFCIFTRI